MKSVDIAQNAADRWNAGADEYNQWDALGQDEKDDLIAAEQIEMVRIESVCEKPTSE